MGNYLYRKNKFKETERCILGHKIIFLKKTLKLCKCKHTIYKVDNLNTENALH